MPRSLAANPSDFYPRSPCGERPRRIHTGPARGNISIHALLAESDVGPITHSGHPLYNFYPRSPCGERRAREGRRGAKPRISIHALLAESDVRARAAEGQSPELLSTLSLRRATAIGRRGRAARGNFYPRSPCGERQGRVLQDITPAGTSIHALLAESDPFALDLV